MIQTHFVRLEPPYQVIFCNGQLGVQIGSLIAVEEKRGKNGEYGIVTHTHPVVNYGDKRMLEFWNKGVNDVWTSPGDFFQGAVWDKAEVNDVVVIGTLKEGHGVMSEKGFSELVARTLVSRIQEGTTIQNTIFALNRDLRLLGMAPQYNSVTEMTLNVEVHDYYDIHYVYLSDDENRFQLAVPIDTIKNMVNMVWRQLDDYEHLLPKGNKPQWKFVHDFLPCHDEDPDEDSVFLREERKADELTKALTELYSPKK